MSSGPQSVIADLQAELARLNTVLVSNGYSAYNISSDYATLEQMITLAKRFIEVQSASASKANHDAMVAVATGQGGAVRKDDGKPRLDLFSPLALEGTSQILTFGAKKYTAHNWAKGMDWSRCIASLKRHLNRFEMGEDYDEESGLPHIHHIACNTMFLQEYFTTHPELDDRRKLLPSGKKAT